MLSEIEQIGEKIRVFQNCAKCETFQKHIEIATEVRSSYQNQMIMPRNKMTVSVDMQKVIMLPRLPYLKQAISCFI